MSIDLNHLSRRKMLGMSLAAVSGLGMSGELKEEGAGEKNKEKKGMKTGLVYDDIFLEHKTPAGFPERPERLTAIIDRLEKEKILAQLVRLNYSPDGLKWIGTIHSKEYMDRVKKTCEDGVGYIDSLDVPVSSRSYEAAVAAVGGGLAGVDAVMQLKVRNVFCAVRPPGHHAVKNQAKGFCIFNNIAIAARYIQKKYELRKILIVDWDVHHGNGTQDAFYDDPDVLYFSIHRHPFYPGSGSEEERGAGKGLGYKINVPEPAGTGDKEYQKVFEEILRPAAKAFKPDFVLISAGFDAHIDDPLGGMAVTSDGFGELTRIVKEIACTCCEGRIVSLLEGGYDLDGLARSVEAHLRVLMS